MHSKNQLLKNLLRTGKEKAMKKDKVNLFGSLYCVMYME